MRKSNITTIFNYPKLNWRSWHGFWQNIFGFFKTFKIMWQRAWHGYSEYDLYSLDYYLMEVLPNALRDFSDRTESTPVDKTFEEWRAELNSIAQDIENGNDENNAFPNVYEEEMAEYWGKSEKCDESLRVAWYNEENKCALKRDESLQRGWARVGIIFRDLWI